MWDGLRKRKQQLVPSGCMLKRCGFGNYGADIIVEILSRLPVKSLLRFRCVCKSWRAVTSDSHFVRKHLSHTVKGRVMYSVNPLRSIDYEALLKDGGGGPVPDRMHELQEWCPEQRFIDCRNIVGSCNGLICLKGDHGCFLLWNPTTKDTNKLPKQKFRPRFYGFGYNSTTEDYKVVLGGSRRLRNQIAIFTLKKNSWTVEKLKNVDLYGLRGQGCLLNGSLHWLGLCSSSSRARITAFDLVEEKFQEVMPLPDVMTKNCESARVGTIRNSVCVYLWNHNSCYLRITIWVMKEYGVNESWTELMKIPNKIVSFGEKPICILENGEVLVSCHKGRSMALCNPKEKKNNTFFDTPTSLSSKAVMYSETLVSPITGN